MALVLLLLNFHQVATGVRGIALFRRCVVLSNACATLAVIRPRMQITLVVVFVPPDVELVTVLQKLLKYVRQRGLRIGCLYADKQFCTIPVLRYLQTQTTVAAIIKESPNQRG